MHILCLYIFILQIELNETNEKKEKEGDILTCFEFLIYYNSSKNLNY